jgi:hypothetical protein
VAEEAQDFGGRTVAVRNATFASEVDVSVQRQNDASTREGDIPPNQGGDIAAARRPGALIAERASGMYVTLTRRHLEGSSSLGYALTVFRPYGLSVPGGHRGPFVPAANDGLCQEAGTQHSAGGGFPTTSSPSTLSTPRGEIAQGYEDVAPRDALTGLVAVLSQNHEKDIALESLPPSPLADDVPPRRNPPPAHSDEEWFQDYARDPARADQRASNPPAQPHQWAWARSHSSHDLGYDVGLGLWSWASTSRHRLWAIAVLSHSPSPI